MGDEKNLSKSELNSFSLSNLFGWVGGWERQIIMPNLRFQDRPSEAKVTVLIYFLSDRPGLKNLEEIRKLNDAVCNSLQRELMHNPTLHPIKEEVSTISLLMNKRHTLRYSIVIDVYEY